MNDDLNTLPKEVRQDVIETLGAFNHCSAKFEFGEWKVRASSSLSNGYAPDFKIFNFEYEDLKDLEEVKKARKDFYKSLKR